MGRAQRPAPPSRDAGAAQGASSARIRLDKWLWAARFYKTRALAMEALEKGRILVGGLAAKPSREVHLGDEIEIREPGGLRRIVRVTGLSDVRGPAPVARTLYAETESSQREREAALALRRMGVEPALAQANGRPTKRDRRELVEWDRWSARWDGEPKRDPS